MLPFTPQGELVASLAEIPAGTGLSVQLAGLDFAALSEAQLLEAARAWERQDRWLAARRNELYAALDAAPGPDWEGQPPARCVEEWQSMVASARHRSLAASVGMSPFAASQRVDAAAQLAFDGRLSRTGAALADGRLSEASARLIATRLVNLEDDLAREVQEVVLPQAALLPWRKLESAVRRAIAERRTAAEHLEHESALSDRRVGAPQPGDFGMATLQVHGPAADVQVLYTAITALGEASKAVASAASLRDCAAQDGTDGAPDGIDAHRFDALIALACGALAADGSDLPTRHGRRPSIQVTVPASTLLRLSDAPGELEGYGPITADAARHLAGDPTATWRRILTDPIGRVLDYGTRTYRPPQDLTDLVIARDGTCTFPGCAKPARRCQIDHIQPFPAGSTSETNTDAKCGRDHNLKTAGLLSSSRDPESGTTTWADRHGTRYLRPPATLPTDPEHEEGLVLVARALARGRDAVLADAGRQRRAASDVLERDANSDPPPF